jgi:preprotein translocase subunit SecD
MLRLPKWKLIATLLVLLGGVYFAAPSFTGLKAGEESALDGGSSVRKINLGLDLRGGSELLLELDLSSYEKEIAENLAEEIKATLRKAELGYRNVVISNGDVEFEAVDEAEVAKITSVLGAELGAVESKAKDMAINVGYNDTHLQERKLKLIEQTIEIVRRRVDETGTREPIIQAQGSKRVLVQVPGLSNPEKLKSIIGKTAQLTFHMVDTDALTSMTTSDIAPPGAMILPGKDSQSEDGSRGGVVKKYIVKRRALLSGEYLVDSQATFDQGMPAVSFKFDSTGSRKFGDATSQNVNKPFAIVLDGKVLSAPVIREPILGGTGIITGDFTVEEANELALLLRAGALPVPLKIVEERTVGPSLGQDSIDAGEAACLVSLGLVIFFMLAYYGLFGVFACFSLAFNLILLVAAMSLLQATLTLPGIAGIVLTIGMAVDANVLIYERIKEESRNGLSPMAAVEAGFNRALGTILDSNITTLIAALILFWLGSGTIKGFAVTLALGIISSMFTAVFVNRLMVYSWMLKFRPARLEI